MEYIIKVVTKGTNKKTGKPYEFTSYYQHTLGGLITVLTGNTAEAKVFTTKRLADLKRKQAFGNSSRASVIPKP